MIKSITSVKVAGRRVLVRCGFDVPLKKNPHTEEWEVADEMRIKDSLPTINYLIKHQAKIILISHLDRPHGWEENKSLWPVASKLGELLGYKVVKVSNKLPDYKVPHINFLTGNILSADYSELSYQLDSGDILLLENIRFYKEEMENDTKLVNMLASFADLFVNDALSVAHRKEASTFGVAQKLKAFAGLSLVLEINSLNKIIKNPTKPFIVLIGGAKITDKVDAIHNLAKSAQHILVGGAVANVFLKVAGYQIGQSYVSDEAVARQLWRNYKDKIVLPDDLVVARSKDSEARAVPKDKIKPFDVIFDIGPKTIRKFSDYIREAKTLVWNGPVGLIEVPRFSFGSKSMAHIFAARAKGKAFGVVGGGETVELIDQAKVRQFIDFVSTGGGAMLEFLAGKELPGVRVLESK